MSSLHQPNTLCCYSDCRNKNTYTRKSFGNIYWPFYPVVESVKKGKLLPQYLLEHMYRTLKQKVLRGNEVKQGRNLRFLDVTHLYL